MYTLAHLSLSLDSSDPETFTVSTFEELIHEAKASYLPYLLAVISDTASPRLHPFDGKEFKKYTLTTNFNPINRAKIIRVHWLILMQGRVFHPLDEKLLEPVLSDDQNVGYLLENNEMAKQWWKLAALRGSSAAMKQLAYLSSSFAAHYWLTKAAIQGDREAIITMSRDSFNWQIVAALIGDKRSIQEVFNSQLAEGKLQKAAQWIEKIDEQMQSDACFALAMKFADCHNFPAAFFWMTEAGKRGFVKAHETLSAWYTERGDQRLALNHLQEAAKCGNVAMQFFLGKKCNDRQWLAKAADAGHPEACFLEGAYFALEQKWTEAVHFWEKIDTPASSVGMGLLAYKGIIKGGQKYAKRKWRGAARKGNAAALYYLGRIFQLKCDLQKAADLGHPLASYDLGVAAFHRGEFIVARALFKMAAKAKISDAVFAEGLICYQESDLDEAYRLWIKAALMGNKEALINMALLLRQKGEWSHANVWWKKAMDAGAKKTDTLQLTPKSRSLEEGLAPHFLSRCKA